MRKVNGVVAVPITACLLLATVGCSSLAAAAPATVNYSTAATTNLTSNAKGVGTATPAPTSTPAKTTEATQTATATQPQKQAPFPGIWDITTWEKYRDMQESVRQGHQPWLRNPSMVVQAWAAQWQPMLPVRQVSANVFQVVEPGTSITYTVHGICPDPDSSAPIWVITSISHD